MREIISQVQSPFSDENIQKLIEKYINWDGDFSDFYRMINGVDASKMTTNLFLAGVNDRLWRMNKIGDTSSEFWNIILSEKNYLKIPNNYHERTQLYRIYLNLKGEDKARAVQEYVQKCESRNKGYKFKYSKKDGRDDEIVIITDAENLAADIEIIQQIIQGMQPGQLPQLAGRYTHGIGIVEEYVDAPIYSYTEVRLDMIPKAITKYILDNSVEFIEYCDAKQVSLIADISKFFREDTEFAEHCLNELPEDSGERQRLEKERSAYKANVNFGQIGYGTHIVVVKELLTPLRVFMEENSERALPEMVANFRTACKVHGISEQGVFSLSTEQKVREENSKTQEKTLSEIQQELEKLIKLERRTSQKRDEAKLIRNAYQAELDREEGQTY